MSRTPKIFTVACLLAALGATVFVDIGIRIGSGFPLVECLAGLVILFFALMAAHLASEL